ncbi:ATP-grasp domain-containing protein [Bradyrhizobium sp. 180]|uniref:ATP-grasp domain-containing protein n=1 Tax=unclassified Bradyrhizobium TaxID=2631580 RepID=UPI001FF82395|nr:MULTISPECIES: ATP-grasp domain-containing protein [unclassified Bradyrhizobium]MCK1419935.1 ATP-grasp domain-containing protein [Bradyrhizobium sp. CW12]MCK1493606.1 ATP-grasp domain-containing protein [Bradyrhizobium sp. 180]MCK1529605.1 ATP-grasp domain-containing protein [Bradyrhizobium sp. 182]MCK1593651.1 ATP-grasp domain-containing protein [Bradyrhizobium sp. 164]MCK1616920.1 ATP-grasp domain-containing protein [Bradyrhizobium sp. 159]
MASGERIFIQAIRRYCADHGIAVDVHASGWLVAMRRGKTRRFAFGYDIGLNSAIAHRLANDKSATAEALALEGVPCIPHQLFLNPKLGQNVVGPTWRGAMLELLHGHPQGVVVKPNEGTSGRSVFKVTTEAELDHAVGEVFSMSAGLVISPYVAIEDEVRVVLLDDVPLVVYGKQRGRDWRHNLDGGAKPVLLESGEVRTACVKLAIDAARAIGIAFASIDVVRVDADWCVLEINSGVMMESLAKLHPELVQATYDAALDRVFAGR